MDRRLRLFSTQIAAVTGPAIHVPGLDTTPPFITVGPRGPQAIDELDLKLQEHENRIGQMNSSWETLVKKQRELEEARHVLRETATFFQQVRRPISRSSLRCADLTSTLSNRPFSGSGPTDGDSIFVRRRRNCTSA